MLKHHKRQFADTVLDFWTLFGKPVGKISAKRPDGKQIPEEEAPRQVTDGHPLFTDRKHIERVARNDPYGKNVFLEWPKSGTVVGFEAVDTGVPRAFFYATDDDTAWDRYRKAADPVGGCKHRVKGGKTGENEERTKQD